MGRDPNPERPEALQDWEACFALAPPPYLSVAFMQKAVRFEAQCKAMGGVSAATKRVLRQIANGDDDVPARTITLRPGAHLVRNWQGRTYQVQVVDGGYVMDGKTWSSLSAIAKHITGATWSGPRFFGINLGSGNRR